MTREYLFAGFGGQGVMSMGMVLAHAALFSGHQVSWLPSYGPEQRGGTANCMVVVSSGSIGSPLVTDPDVAVVMNGPSLAKFGSSVRGGGILFINRSLVEEDIDRGDVAVIALDCLAMAGELGEVRVANMIMLGAVLAHTSEIPLDQAFRALAHVLPERHAHLLDLNCAALLLGFQSALR